MTDTEDLLIGPAGRLATRVRQVVAEHSNVGQPSLGDLIYEAVVHQIVVTQVRKSQAAVHDRRWADEAESLALYWAFTHCRRIDLKRIDPWAGNLFLLIKNAIQRAYSAANPESRHMTQLRAKHAEGALNYGRHQKATLALLESDPVMTVPLDLSLHEPGAVSFGPDDIVCGTELAAEIRAWLDSGLLPAGLETELRTRLSDPGWNGKVPAWVADRARRKLPATLLELAGAVASSHVAA